MSLLKRAFNIIDVQQRDHTVRIQSVLSSQLAADIRRIWGTSRIVSNMFTDLGKKHVEFKTFFALELEYMLRKIAEDRRSRTSKRNVQRIIDGLHEHTWIGGLDENRPHTSILNQRHLSLFYKQPLPHQTEFFDHYDRGRARLGLHGFLLSAAAGSGKTLTCLMTAEMVESDYVIIVSPNNAVDRVWCSTLENEYKKPQPYWVAGSSQPYRGERFLVTHYEGLAKLTEAARRLRGNITIVLDECHNFNEIRSLRTQLFIELCQLTQSQNVIWSSGTPIKALGGEAIPLLTTIDPQFDTVVSEQFKQIFGVNARRALDILRHRMGFIQYRTEKVVDNKPTEETVHVRLPNGQAYTLEAVSRDMSKYAELRQAYYDKNFKKYEAIYQAVIDRYRKLPATAEQVAEFEQYQKDFRTVQRLPDARFTSVEMRNCNGFERTYLMPLLRGTELKDFRKAKSVVKYPKLVVMGEVLGNILGKARSRLQVELVQHVDWKYVLGIAVKKTVVFTSYVEVVKELERIYSRMGLKSLSVHGETNRDLGTILTSFDKNPQIDPLIATYPSLSTAVPLVMADAAVFTNVPFRDHELVQAKARIDRLGQDTPVKFIYVYLDTGNQPNISTRSKDILEWSREQAALIMGQDYSGDIALESLLDVADLDEPYLGEPTRRTILSLRDAF